MTTDILLSVPDLFLTMGLPSIDESLDKLLVACGYGGIPEVCYSR